MNEIFGMLDICDWREVTFELFNIFSRPLEGMYVWNVKVIHTKLKKKYELLLLLCLLFTLEPKITNR